MRPRSQNLRPAMRWEFRSPNSSSSFRSIRPQSRSTSGNAGSRDAQGAWVLTNWMTLFVTTRPVDPSSSWLTNLAGVIPR